MGIGVGLALPWGRLTGRRPREGSPGVGLLLAVFGLIAIVSGLQGLFTPDN